jgi:hypothetical protein
MESTIGGVWCDTPNGASGWAAPVQDDALLLAALGYDIYDISRLDAARGAYRRHFLADENTAPFTDSERA